MTYHSAMDRATVGAGAATRRRLVEGALRLPFRTEIVRSRSRFSELAPDWDALASLHETPLALHGWYEAALEAQSDSNPDLCIPLIWRGNRLVAAAPLMHSLEAGPCRLVPIDAFTGEPDRIIYCDADALLALADACAELGEPLLFRRFAAPQADAIGFAKRLRRHAPGMFRELHRASFVAMPDDFDAFEASMSKSRRKTIRRKQKLMDEAGGCELSVFCPAEEEVAPLLERFARIEDASWKGRAGTSLLGDPLMAKFVLQVARTFARTGDTFVTILKIGEEDAAGRVVLQHGKSWCGIKVGFDEQFARFAPGIIQMHETLRHAHERGIRNYRFLGVSEDWQNYWPHERRSDYRLAAYPVSFASCRALLDDAKTAVGSLLRRF
ncbi:GNAT family N-acetyltransferase [Qipengyuania soli]|uniref:GNAT family N-acetyltransferase n=1 Tax=Qipengyuania soli TaxID=2782568 RepID=A0A7S8F4T3_9SPHN|nr:GNAT family N-acetyltransferase [Qipengyuania soli]QPC99141.1 GNAT family N-acetyltransferase [Qipengyuania soli]